MPDDRKETQRQRLLDAMIEVAARDGYRSASIAQVVSRAGVSRPTFYDYFADKDDCFIAALAEAHERLLEDVAWAVECQAPELAARSAVAATIAFARSQPAMARVLMSEAVSGGRGAMDTRDRGLAAIEDVVEDAYARLAPQARVPDLSTRVLIGGVYHLLASRLRRGPVKRSGLSQELAGWLGSYERALGEHRWRSLSPSPPTAPAAKSPPLLAPKPLTEAGAGRSAKEVAENQRQRILFAAAQIAAEEGYDAASITRITARAGVDNRAFHRFFADRQELFAAVHELHFQHVMAAAAGAFFTDASWPERVWAAGLALAQAIEENPTLAHVGLVEAYAGETVSVERVDQLGIAFTFFLRDGYAYEPQPPPSQVALAAIAASSYEIAYTLARGDGDAQMSGLLPHAAFLSLAPFLGAAEANRFIEEKLAAG